MKRITIIGGGASGTLLAVNLIKLSGDVPIEINVIERRGRIGRGVAFGTIHSSHLLNVPCGRMGAFPDDIGHFHSWLSANGHNYDSDDFVPRRLFGEYLRSIFDQETVGPGSNIRVNLIDDEAVYLSVNGSSAEVELRSGEIVPSHRVVLAFGNFKPPHPNVIDLAFIDSPNYFQNPWGVDLYESVAPDDTIFVVGTGLSMIDVALHLNKSGHTGKISAISTRGLLPAVHKLGYTYPGFYDELKDLRRITDILKAVRRHVRLAEDSGSNWRAVIDCLRPVTQQIWLDLPLPEKKYFMQHLSRYWNVARHRMPAAAAETIDEMQKNDRLEILRGRLRSITVTDTGFDISYARFDVEHHSSANILVNCIGSQANFNKIESTFVENLIDRNHIRNDELSQGIAASPDGRVVDKNGEFSEVVYTLGTALRGTLWETTAIPEIRTQARNLALRLLAD